ncbi:MAG: CDP-6-deoxy-delta-3,4-glucoseen reductase [Burkholderiales bacterium]|nr:CDP-6-deoxy-delta-3,4-glucoseen reductase [Burkholderiales bacterium]
MTFNVTLKPAARQFTVERDEAILPAAIRQGIGLPYGCRDGACGSCKSKLVEGRVIHGAHQQRALSAAEEEAGYILTCCATPQTDCVVEARMVPGAGEYPVLKLPTRLLALERVAPDVMVLRLQLPANQNLRFRAGQYVEFILRDGARRSYSMANAPHNLGSPPAIELHVRHMPGGKFTDHVFGAMKEREILRMEGPFGSFFLREDAPSDGTDRPGPPERPIILLASGTGFAPIKAVIEHMRHKGITRPAVLYWGGRRPHDLYMHHWCEQTAAELPSLRYVPVVSDALPEDAWSGREGFVHRAVMEDWPDLSAHQVYACGAPIVVESAKRDFVAQCRLNPDEFYADSFTSEADKHGP